MTQYIGQITVILETEAPELASETLSFLAKQLDDTRPEVVFADHNGEVEDYEKVERECEDSLATPAKAEFPLLTVLLVSLKNCAVLLADYDEHPGEEGIAYREEIAAIALATGNALPALEAAAPPAMAGIDIHALLAERQQIALIWSIADVQHLRPDLDDDQAWEVLQHVDHHKNAGLGISWLTLEIAIEHLFGDASETDKPEEE
jgi:hypothetical protein